MIMQTQVSIWVAQHVFMLFEVILQFNKYECYNDKLIIKIFFINHLLKYNGVEIFTYKFSTEIYAEFTAITSLICS